MSEEDIAVVREQFEAVNRRDFAGAMELYAEDVVLVAPDMDGVWSPGVFEGSAAVGEWFGEWFRTFAPGYSFEIREARALAGGLTFVVATHGGKGRLSGAPVHGETAYLYRVRGGKIVRVGFFPTREYALEAVSLPEWSETETD